MCNSFLQTELVKDSVVLVLDVEKSHTGIASESEVEAEVPPLHILLLFVHSESLSRRLNLHWRRKSVERQIRSGLVGSDPIAAHVESHLLNLSLLPR